VANSDSTRNLVKPIAGITGLLATMASVWWFALRPRSKRKKG
jgi:hypothetical protein